MPESRLQAEEIDIRSVLPQVPRGARNERKAEMARLERGFRTRKTLKGKRTYGLDLKSSDRTGNHAEVGTASVGV